MLLFKILIIQYVTHLIIETFLYKRTFLTVISRMNAWYKIFYFSLLMKCMNIYWGSFMYNISVYLLYNCLYFNICSMYTEYIPRNINIHIVIVGNKCNFIFYIRMIKNLKLSVHNLFVKYTYYFTIFTYSLSSNSNKMLSRFILLLHIILFYSLILCFHCV